MAGKLEQVGPYVLDRYLGEGATGRVIFGHHKDTRQHVAVKIISKDQFVKHQALRGMVQREIALMALADHPNIIKLVDVMENPEQLFVVMEYADGGGLFDYLVARQFITEAQAIDFIRQIILGLEYLHHQGICHRDLKPENILLDEAMRIKIADFGFARWVTDEPLTGSHGSGSPHYAAPEALTGNPYDGRAADIWSVGVIFFTLLARYLPFDDQSPSQLVEKVKRGVFSMPEFSPNVRDLIGRMMTRDVSQRITIPEIKVHPCFLSGLPKGYVLPQPVDIRPVPEINEVPKQLIERVTEFGYRDEDEFRAALAAKGNNISKVLLGLFVRSANPDQFPWFPGQRLHSDVLQDASVMEPNIVAEERTNSNDRFGRHCTTCEDAQLLCEGDVSRPVWFLSGTPNPTLKKQEFKVKARHWDVLFKAQTQLNELGLQWIHPNDQTIMFRTSDKDVYGTFSVRYESETVLNVSVALNSGSESIFNPIAEKLCQI